MNTLYKVLGITVLLTAIIAGGASAEHLYTKTLPFFLDGLDLETGTTQNDPTVLLVLCDQEDEIERVLQPALANLADFSLYPELEFSLHYTPESLFPMQLHPETLLHIATVEKNFALDTPEPPLFQEIDDTGMLPIDPDALLLVKMNTDLFTIEFFTPVGPGCDIKVEHLDTVNPAVPEPTSSLLLALGLCGLCGLLCRRRTQGKASKGALVIFIVLTFGVAHTALGADLLFRKLGTGNGTIMVGEEECDAACQELTLPYTDHTMLILKALPDAQSHFMRWQTADGIPLTRKYYAQAGDVVDAIFAYIMTPDGGAAMLHDGSASVSFPAGAISQEAYIDISPLPHQSIPPANPGFQRVSTGYEFQAVTPQGGLLTQFNDPVDVTLRYETDELLGGNADDCEIHFYDETEKRWVALPSTPDVAAQTITAVSTHFTTFAIFRPVDYETINEFNYHYWFEHFALPPHELERISVKKTFIANHTIAPFPEELTLYGLALQADVQLEQQSSLVRIILVDALGQEYLLFEAYPFIRPQPTFSLADTCEETWNLAGITPASLKIQLIDASIRIHDILIDQTPKAAGSDLPRFVQQINAAQNIVKIQSINDRIQEQGLQWTAGETSISQLSYAEKNRLFPDEYLPNLQGFEYYSGGIFEVPSTDDSSSTPSSEHPGSNSGNPPPSGAMVKAFDWRNRHGENWVTSVKNQHSCGSCGIFAATGATEALVNLYFNQHINVDLAEQDAVSCSGYSGAACNGGTGWSPGYILDYYTRTGVVNESCFPYTATDRTCSNKCSNPAEVIKIGGRIPFGSSGYPKTDDTLKKLIVEYGPVSGGIYSWSHAMTLVGYETDPADGRTVWIFKNSWGTWWGASGYTRLKVNMSDIGWTHALLSPVSSSRPRQISCVDKDNDGYCNWGISPNKPASCPSSCQPQKDCDDSNPRLGPFGSDYSCTTITSRHTIQASAGSGGSIVPSGSVTVTQGASQTFTISAASGYRIKDVLVDGVSVGARTSYTFPNVNHNHTIQAVFELQQLPAPTGITATDGSSAQYIRITWNSVAGASYYRVYRNTSPDAGGASLIGSWQSSRSYYDYAVTPGTTYYYWIRAAVTSSGSRASRFSAYDTGYAEDPRAPEINIRHGSIQIPVGYTYDFGLVGSATHRFVIQNLGDASLSLNGSPRVQLSGASAFSIRTQPATATVAPGEEIFFDIDFIPEAAGTFSTTVAIHNNDVTENPYTFTITASGTLTQPTGLSATDGTYANKVRLTWNSVADASYYKVYRGTGFWPEDATPLGNWQAGQIYDDYSAVPGQHYYYWIKAAKDSSGAYQSWYSAYDQGYAAITSVDQPDLILSDLKVTSYTATSISYQYTIKNIGIGPANLDGPTDANHDNVTVQAFLSADTVFNNAGDLPGGGTIIGLSPLGWLAPGETFSGSFNSGAMFNPAVTPYLTMMVDWSDDIDESNENNNTIAVLIPVQDDCDADLPAPQLALSGTETYRVNGQEFTRYSLKVLNYTAYPDTLFEAAPHLPACGLNTNSSRTWVNIYDDQQRYIYGFCALSTAGSLNGIWFAVAKGEPKPQSVYITLQDRECHNTYTSNRVNIP